ncbi:MAG TPA: SRPBCC domain-containing protein [Bryobacteraceae bacterium]|jgi:hypothetical protein|nr:SRPBCC domain-containing protein [Bryobacteraceae bacterium]
MAKIILGNHMAVFAARSEQDRIRKFYCGVLGCKANVTNDEVDRFQLGDVHFCFVWQDSALGESSFLKATYLELKTDNTEEMEQKILAFGVKQLDVPDAHFYFQAPGGQVFKLVGIGEDLSLYEESPSSKPGSCVDYQRTIQAGISPAEALSRINRVSDWWTKNFNGRSQNPDDQFTIRFGETFVDFQVSEVVPGKKVAWQVTDCNLHWINDKKEWKGSSIVWELSSNDGTTQVKMKHVGLAPRAECYANCKAGWDFFVGESLLKLLNENQGLPDQRPR